ncbi:MAG TPA: DUF5666 domain-containing protein [Candidatus Limnocylindrales bacterium]
MTDQWTPSDEPTPTTPTQFSARTRLRRGEILRIGVVIGSLVVLVASAAVTIGASPSATTSPAGASPAASGAAPGLQQRPGASGPGFRFGWPGGFGGMFGGPTVTGLLGERFGGIGRSITITKIEGSNVSLKTDDGWTRTIAVTGTTKIRVGSQAGAIADLKVGDIVSLNETKNTDGTFTVTLVVVRVPTVAGTVTVVTATGFTLKQRDGSSRTVTFSSSTNFLIGATKSSKADLSVGARVEVEGANGSGTSFAATVIHIVPDVRAGKVTAKTSTTITIQGRGGATQTIHVDATTTFKVMGATTAKLADVTVGMYISAQGLSRADGSLDATSVFGGSLRVPKSLPVKPNASASPST